MAADAHAAQILPHIAVHLVRSITRHRSITPARILRVQVRMNTMLAFMATVLDVLRVATAVDILHRAIIQIALVLPQATNLALHRDTIAVAMAVALRAAMEEEATVVALVVVTGAVLAAAAMVVALVAEGQAEAMVGVETAKRGGFLTFNI